MDYRWFQKQIDFLLENASPNILYRIRKEILKETTDSSEMKGLQAKILTLTYGDSHRTFIKRDLVLISLLRNSIVRAADLTRYWNCAKVVLS